MGASKPLCRLFGQVTNLSALDVIISTLSHSCTQLSSQRPLVYAYLLLGGKKRSRIHITKLTQAACFIFVIHHLYQIIRPEQAPGTGREYPLGDQS